jgi:hypothetical protein
MTKYDVQKIMLEAAKVTLFFDEKKIHYVAGRTPDGADEMVIADKGHIDAEFVDNIVKQVAKECIAMLDKELSEAYGAYGDGLDEAIELICNRYGVER